jgi:hypothetical protein
MDDEVLAGDAPLVGVVLAGERERVQDGAAVDRLGDLVGVLGDDREQVGEQLVLERRQVVRDRQRAVVAVIGAVDLAVVGDRDLLGAGRASGDDGRGGPRGVPRGGAANGLRADLLGCDLQACVAVAAAQAAASAMSLLVRNCRPSSSRRW